MKFTLNGQASPSDAATTRNSDFDTRRLPPDPEGAGTQQAMVHRAQEATTDPTQIQHDALHRQESSHVRGRFELAHLSLAVPGRLVRHFGSIVLVLPCVVQHGRHDGPVRRRATAPLVCDQTERSTAYQFQEFPGEARSGVAVSRGRQARER